MVTRKRAARGNVYKEVKSELNLRRRVGVNFARKRMKRGNVFGGSLGRTIVRAKE